MPSKLAGVAARLGQLPQGTVTEAVARFDVIARESAARVVGNGGVMKMHLRGNRRLGVQLTTNVQRTGSSGDSAFAFVEGLPRALWHWIELGTAGHAIGTRPRTFLKAPSYGHPIRGPIGHPGATGAGAWTRALADFGKEFPDVVIKNLREAMS